MSGADPRLRAMLKLAPVIPVFTPDDVDDAVQVAQALFRGGLPVIEVTLRTPRAMEAIKAMVEAVPEAVIGAGTVLEGRQLEQLKAVGGRFAVSPGATRTERRALADGISVLDESAIEVVSSPMTEIAGLVQVRAASGPDPIGWTPSSRLDSARSVASW